MFIEADSVDQVQRSVVKVLLSKGRRVRPRGQWVYEVTGLSFRLNNPRARLVYSKARKFSLPFAVGEMCWYLRGTNRLDIISYYSRRYRQFSDDGMTLYGAYGRRLFTNELTGSVQWQAALRCLQRDPDTRQAVLHLHLPQDLLADTKDVPCTCYLQFFIRENRLEMIVNMRSNDIIWGTAYDVFSFTMMQEIMARQLRLEVGPYMHFAGSMHIYDRHLQMAEEILSERPYRTFEMPRMPEDPWKGLHELLRTEEELRTSGVACSWPEDEYWHQLAIVLQIYAVTKSGHEAHTLSLRPKLMGCYESLLFRGDALVRREGGTPL